MTASSEMKSPPKTQCHDLPQKEYRKAKERGRLDGIKKVAARNEGEGLKIR